MAAPWELRAWARPCGLFWAWIRPPRWFSRDGPTGLAGKGGSQRGARKGPCGVRRWWARAERWSSQPMALRACQ